MFVNWGEVVNSFYQSLIVPCPFYFLLDTFLSLSPTINGNLKFLILSRLKSDSV